MCILFVYVNNSGQRVPGEYRLIVASNRDEYYARAAEAAAPWEDCDHVVIGGRDMEPGREGGTWLAAGCCEGTIRIGALLNVTGEDHSSNAVTGRGPIVSNYLRGKLSCEDYSKQLLLADGAYPAFNFVSIELDQTGGAVVLHSSNAPRRIDRCNLEGPLGFGNSTFEVPLEKVKNGRQRFGAIVDKRSNVASRDSLVENLFNMLRSNEKYFPDEELSRRTPAQAEHLASINVRIPEAGYGTRTRTVILVDHENRMEFIEETMASSDPDGEWKRTELQREF
ncbi:transport and Golgi organization protein 2 [Toxorhynchites rutilus septentrionalis]|uniref:transport and Golgi organization protein 2 n=1 Tax=Toxorhynchites rutilus septentrionalis TaxID=329112 RepID=UPI0024784455|nr:transport and Golgi organization protein 2 [Toxorhynchites rutilus septentrionalis]